MTKIFISYASHDAACADEYYQALVACDYDVWMDRAELKGGHEWVHVIQERIRWSDTMVVLWSASALASSWVEMEMTYAHTLRKKIIPVQIDNTSPQEHMIINARQVIDGRDVDCDTVVVQIQDSINRDHNPHPITTGVPLVSPKIEPTTPIPVTAPLAQQPTRRWPVILAAAALLVAAALLLALTQQGEPPALNPTPTSAPTPVLPTLSPGLLSQPATLANINQWRASSNLSPLNQHAALQGIAEQHLSYLRSLPLSELESTNIFRNADGQDVIFMANEAGYTGDVLMVVETTDENYTLQNLLDELDDQARYVDAGWEQVRSIATNKLYYVLILGTGAG